MHPCPTGTPWDSGLALGDAGTDGRDGLTEYPHTRVMELMSGHGVTRYDRG